MSFRCMLGSKLEYVETLKIATINYKHKSFFGFGGDMSQRYTAAKYRCTGLNNAEVKNPSIQIVAFIQEGIPVNQNKIINQNFEFGVDNGIMFLV